MVQLVPTKILDWLNPKNFSLDTYLKHSSISCFSEVDLNYPDEIHDLQNDYPLVGEQKSTRRIVV